MTNRIAAALPVRDIRQNRNVEPIEPRTAGEDSVGALRVAASASANRPLITFFLRC